jgi:hypothetical protein
LLLVGFFTIVHSTFFFFDKDDYAGLGMGDMNFNSFRKGKPDLWWHHRPEHLIFLTQLRLNKRIQMGVIHIIHKKELPRLRVKSKPIFKNLSFLNSVFSEKIHSNLALFLFLSIEGIDEQVLPRVEQNEKDLLLNEVECDDRLLVFEWTFKQFVSTGIKKHNCIFCKIIPITDNHQILVPCHGDRSTKLSNCNVIVAKVDLLEGLVHPEVMEQLVLYLAFFVKEYPILSGCVHFYFI